MPVLIKWVRCAVGDRAGFDAGQRGWGELATRPGFRAQLGGWSGGDAHVFGLWDGPGPYQAFMSGPHDRLAAAQEGTYETIEVRLFEALAITGELTTAGVVRLAHCQVHEDQTHDFVRAQHTVWTPGMATAPGFLGCMLGAREKTDGTREGAEFLVLSGWESAAAHDHYRTGVFPALHQRAKAADHLAAIDGEVVGLQPEWTVQRSS